MQQDQLAKLIADSALGDERAFRELYDAVAPQLLAIAKRLLRDHHRAEDVLQQAMVSIWHSAGDFEPSRSRPTTWLVAIVRNRAIDTLRRETRRHAALVDEQQDIRAVLGQDSPAKIREPLSKSVARKLGQCFEEIGSDPAACIRLAYLDGLTMAEIAAYLERSVGTVKSWIHRGMERLRECVDR